MIRPMPAHRLPLVRAAGVAAPAALTALAALAALALGAAGSAAAGPDLVHLEVQGERGDNARTVDAEFDEVERDEYVSRARVQARPGMAASLPLFIVRGFCAVAESRGAAFFRPRPEREPDGDGGLYSAEFADERIAVTPAREPAPAGVAAPLATASAGANLWERSDGVFSIDDCRLLGFVR